MDIATRKGTLIAECVLTQQGGGVSAQSGRGAEVSETTVFGRARDTPLVSTASADRTRAATQGLHLHFDKDTLFPMSTFDEMGLRYVPDLEADLTEVCRDLAVLTARRKVRGEILHENPNAMNDGTLDEEAQSRMDRGLVERLTQEYLETARGELVYIEMCEQASDPYMVVRAIRFLADDPSPYPNEKWFFDVLSALIRIACPCVSSPKGGEALYADLRRGMDDADRYAREHYAEE